MSKENFRKEILIEEIGLINNKINHFYNLRLKIKQVAIVLWTAAIGFGLKEDIITLFVIASFVPVPFWLIDTTYRRYYVGWNARFFAISKFLRAGKYKVKDETVVTLKEFLSSNESTAFPILDCWGNDTIEPVKHRQNTSFNKSFFYHTSVLVYVPMILIAAVLAILSVFGVKL